MPYAQVRGARLYYEDHGHGPPLVLIPGALGTAQSDFGPQLEQLPGLGVRVISLTRAAMAAPARPGARSRLTSTIRTPKTVWP